MDNLTFYLLLSLCLVTVLFVVYIISNAKSGKRKKSGYTSEYNSSGIQPNNKAEFEQLHDLISKLKSENHHLKKRTRSLRKQIDDLKEQNNYLEKANTDLRAQKEKLKSSKIHLEELQNKKEQLFAMAVHDIKNPASAIKGFVDLLKSYDMKAIEQQEIMEILIETSSKIVEIAQNMSVIIAKPDVEEILDLKKTSIKKIVDKVCNRNQVYAQQKEIKLSNISSPDTPEIFIDQSRMDEVLENLVNNAIKFAPKRTIVQVKTYFNKNSVMLEVSDNGVGMSKDDLSKIFKKGAKLTPRPTGGEPSSGLGLWIVKNTVEEHNGKISVESKEGAGTKFVIELPREI